MCVCASALLSLAQFRRVQCLMAEVPTSQVMVCMRHEGHRHLAPGGLQGRGLLQPARSSVSCFCHELRA